MMNAPNFFVESVTSPARTHFQSPDRPGQGRQQLVFTIDKSILAAKCILGEMMHSRTDDDISIAGTTSCDHDNEATLDDKDGGGIDIESSRFYTAAKQDAVINDCGILAARTKEHAISLFK